MLVIFIALIISIKSKISRCFLLLSRLEPLIWMLTFWGSCDVTSGLGSPEVVDGGGEERLG